MGYGSPARHAAHAYVHKHHACVCPQHFLNPFLMAIMKVDILFATIPLSRKTPPICPSSFCWAGQDRFTLILLLLKILLILPDFFKRGYCPLPLLLC